MAELQDTGLPSNAINAIKAVLVKEALIEAASIYGSRAKGNYRPGSDIDICLIAPSLTLKDQLQIETALDDLLLPWEIDITVKHRIDNLALLSHIERCAITLI